MTSPALLRREEGVAAWRRPPCPRRRRRSYGFNSLASPVLNWPRGITLMSAKSSSLRKFREFHSGTVLGKNEYLYTSRRPWKQW